jgi:hypothetical protein
MFLDDGSLPLVFVVIIAICTVRPPPLLGSLLTRTFLRAGSKVLDFDAFTLLPAIMSGWLLHRMLLRIVLPILASLLLIVLPPVLVVFVLVFVLVVLVVVAIVVSATFEVVDDAA